jgi:hypothetical protein
VLATTRRLSPSETAVETTLLMYKSPGDRLFTPGPRGVNSASPVSGLVPNGLLAMHANADGLVLLRASLASELVLVEKSFSNDDVEGYFSEIVRKCGYKPAVRTTEGVCANIETLRVVRSDPEKEFYAYVSGKKKYADEDSSGEQQRLWNNGSKTCRSSPEYIEWIAHRHDTLIKEVNGKSSFIRSFYKTSS